ncbi:thioesterase domain-containing protein [Methylobacterium sp. EM32]|uniref:thioesterase II family protein n=1 Tax=Methylobacterium sp. EM32 TaxID=3163481 RepID=UPI0033ADEF13
MNTVPVRGTTAVTAGTRRWLPHANGATSCDLRLICLPYAGGGASVFAPLRRHAPDWLDVLPVQLPGRENRMAEAAIAAMPTLVDALTEALAPVLDQPYALLGYSVGARVAFCLTQALARAGLPPPRLVMVAAHRAPDLPARGPALHTLPSAEFWDRLARYEGTPAAILDNPEFRALFEAPLRADFALAETPLDGAGQRLPCPVAAFAGSRDALVSPADIAGWARATSAGFDCTTIAGGHFFLRDAAEEFRAAVYDRLAPLARRARHAA